MPRLLVTIRKRVIILQCQGYSLKDIQCILKKEGAEISVTAIVSSILPSLVSNLTWRHVMSHSVAS